MQNYTDRAEGIKSRRVDKFNGFVDGAKLGFSGVAENDERFGAMVSAVKSMAG